MMAFACAVSLGSASYAQHHAGHISNPGFGGFGHTMSRGGYQGGGSFQTTGPATYGGPGLVQQFGGSNNYGLNNYGSNYGGYNSYGGYNDFGSYQNYAQYNYGGVNNSVGFVSRYPIGDRTLGGTYSSPRSTFGTYSNYSYPYFGVSRGYGALNYSTGYYSPVIWSAPYASYSPSVFGYGSSVLSGNYVGNYVSNGYVGLIPNGGLSSYYYPGWPYITGLSPYSPAAIIAPTMLNLNVITQPVVPSVSSYSLTDPRLIDQLAPALQPGDLIVPPPPLPAEQDGAVVPDEPLLQMPGDGTPVLNEFDAVSREQKVSTLAEKIQSLRYQSSGDDAFQKADYATADVFYATAIKTAPDRRAPYLRMAISRIALSDFPEAVRYLKTGLAMESDASRPWVTAEELYGQKIAERARSHGGILWNWLAERPLSADRLLLAGTFQKLRGYDRTADQMLELATHKGTEALLVSQVQQLANHDVGPRSISDDLNHLIDQEPSRRASAATQEIQSAQQRSVEQSGGIFMRGGDKTTGPSGTARTSTLENAPPQPDPLIFNRDSETAPVPFEIPVPE